MSPPAPSPSSSLTTVEVVAALARLAAATALTYYSLRWILDSVDPDRKQRAADKAKAVKTLRRLGLTDKAIKSLTEHEVVLASNLVEPAEVNASWEDIAGMDARVQEIRETVILPLQRRELFAKSSALIKAPTGVLLHGPPGKCKLLLNVNL